MVLLGQKDGARLEIAQFETKLATDLTPAAPELRLSATTKGTEPGLRLVIQPGEGDGFIADLLGDAPMVIESDLGFSWSSQSGFAFEGGVGFDVDILPDLDLGPIRLDTLHLGAFGGTEGLEIDAAGIVSAGAISITTRRWRNMAASPRSVLPS